MELISEAVKREGVKMEHFKVRSNADRVGVRPREIRNGKMRLALGAWGGDRRLGDRIVRVVDKEAFGRVGWGGEGPEE